MKKQILVTSIATFFLMVSTWSVKAQERPNRDKMNALKVAYITEKVQLTEKESQAFWPIYNAFQEEKKALMPEQKEEGDREPNFSEMTDAQIDAMVAKRFENEQKLLNLKKKYYEKYKTVLSPKKIVSLYKAEKDFRKEVLERLREKRN